MQTWKDAGFAFEIARPPSTFLLMHIFNYIYFQDDKQTRERGSKKKGRGGVGGGRGRNKEEKKQNDIIVVENTSSGEKKNKIMKWVGKPPSLMVSSSSLAAS